MIKKISISMFFIYIISYFIINNNGFYFSINHFLNMISATWSFIFSNPINIHEFYLEEEEIFFLKINFWYNLSFLIIFIFLFFLQKYFKEDEEYSYNFIIRILKKITFIIASFFMSIIFLLSLISYDRYNKEIEYNKIKEKIFIEETNDYFILENKLILKKDLNLIRKEKELTFNRNEIKIKITKTKLKNENEYIDILKNKYKYKINIKKQQKTKFKKIKSFVVEYFINKDYNRDYLIWIDNEIFVITFINFKEKNEDNIKEFNNFLSNSVFIKEENK